MIKWKIAFWTPGNMPVEDGKTFGCAAHGFCTQEMWVNPDDKAYCIWEKGLTGISVAGTYAQALEKLKALNFVPKIVLAVFSKSIGMEDFLVDFNKLIPEVPIVGGGAALGAGQSSGEILPKAEEVALLLVSEGDFIVETANIHDYTEEIIEIKPISERQFNSVKKAGSQIWEDALTYFRNVQKKYGVIEDDFESITLCDLSGRNIHFSVSDGSLKSGSNLPGDHELVVRITTRSVATQNIKAFFQSGDSLVFGCAGLRSLLDKQIETGRGTLAGFMFGELVTLKDTPMFGNLMLAKLVKNK